MRNDRGSITEYALLIVTVFSIGLFAISTLGGALNLQVRNASLQVASLGGEHATTGGPTQSNGNPGEKCEETLTATCVVAEVP